MFSIVVIGASAGGLPPLRYLVEALPIPCAASIFVVMHIGANRSSLPALLTRPGLPSEFAQDGTLIESGHLYIAPPDQHMVLEPGWIRLNRDIKVNFTRPAADPLFESAAAAYGSRVVGIVLSGGGSDGARGLRMIEAKGGMVFIQHPGEAQFPSMPQTAIAADAPDACLTISQIARRMATLCEFGKEKLTRHV